MRGSTFPYQLFRNIYRLLPCQPYSLRISSNILRYTNSFSKQSKRYHALILFSMFE